MDSSFNHRLNFVQGLYTGMTTLFNVWHFV